MGAPGPEVRKRELTRLLALAGVVALLTGRNGASQQAQQPPSITFGMAKVSLGMSVQQVEQHLSEAGRHIQFLPDKRTAIVSVSGNPGDSEGQVTFSGGRAIYAEFQMPEVQNADELAQEIAGAVDSMDTKTCMVSNFSAHGTGGGHSESIFECGSRRFDVMTVQSFGSTVRTINVNIKIGQIVE
jgi:hypothetical protein